MNKSRETAIDPGSVKARFDISDADLACIRDFRETALAQLDNFIEDFYLWLPTLPEFKHFFTDSRMITSVKSQQKEYWKIFFRGYVDREFFDNRLTVGKAHARINLPVNSFCSAMNFSINWWLLRIPSWQKNKDTSLTGAFLKLALLDLTVVTESYAELTNDKIRVLLGQTNAILEKTTRVAEAMAKGDFSQNYLASGEEDERLSNAINQMLDNFKSVVRQAATIAKGDYRAQITPLSEKDELGNALFQMTTTLREMSQRNEQDGWIKNGQAGLTNLMRGDLTIHVLSKNVISYLAKYSNALIGTFYIIDSKERDILRLTGSYAHNFRKGHRGEIRVGEGLVGQCSIEKEMVVFADVPENYLAVNSSLGSSTPQYIVIVPLLFENEVYGVIELGFYKQVADSVMQLFRQVNESIAIAIKSAQDSEKIKILLEESKTQASELQSQQEELKAINEELEKQQSSLQKSNEELEYQTKRLRESEESIRIKNEELKKSTERLEQQKSDLETTTRQVENARHELEAKAKELELASKYKSEFLANMSHELRTPLNSLLILSDSLWKNEEGNLTTEQIESAKIIYSGGKDLLNLINDILDLSKVEAGKLQIDIEDVDVRHVLENLKKQFNPIAKNKSLDFFVSTDDNLATHIRTDRKRFEQILKNFLSNAFKFTSNGSVTLKVHAPDTSIRFARSTLEQKNCLGFSVIDTGIGIPLSKQGIIFGAFQQVDGATNRKYAGTGLGLSISKELAKILSCEIQLTSEPKKGSCFTLYVPHVSQAGARTKATTHAGKKEASNGSRTAVMTSPQATPTNITLRNLKDDREMASVGDRSLLIIEDDENFAKLLMENAKRRGYKCIVALNGQEGLLCAEKFRPSAITLDMVLPDISGDKVLEQLKFNLHTRHIPVHIISSTDCSFFNLQKGAIGHLKKPPSAEELSHIFARFDHINTPGKKKVLVVEDDDLSRLAIQKCIENDNLVITSCKNGRDAFEKLKTDTYDCVILDLNLPEMNGLEILENISKHDGGDIAPIIIYTGKELSQKERDDLAKYSSSIVIKGVKSADRLVDELHLFLHSVESMLPANQQNIVRMFHEPGQLLLGRKVLLVDDDMRNTYALSAALRKKGLNVLMADNGEMALEKLSKTEDVDIVVMDIMMPVMDGYEAIKLIRKQEKYRTLPIIALTAKVMPEDKAKAFLCGANDFLTKPVDVQQLLSLMQILLFRATGIEPIPEIHVR